MSYGDNWEGTAKPLDLSTPCNCVGPQNGEPACPCAMRRLIKRNGRWVQPEVDMGPIIGVDMGLVIGEEYDA